MGAHRGGRGLGVVVDAEQLPTLSGEADRLVAQPAADVEEPAVAHPGPHLAVARGVQREQRVGGLALHGALAGQLHGDSSPGSLPLVPVL